jgi:hypothetical protein
LRNRGHNGRMILRILCSLARWTDWVKMEANSSLSIEEGLERYATFIKTTPRKRYQRVPNTESLCAPRNTSTSCTE